MRCMRNLTKNRITSRFAVHLLRLSCAVFPFLCLDTNAAAVDSTEILIDSVGVAFSLDTAYIKGEEIEFVYSYYNESNDTIAVYLPEEEDFEKQVLQFDIYKYGCYYQYGEENLKEVYFDRLPGVVSAFAPSCTFYTHPGCVHFEGNRIKELAPGQKWCGEIAVNKVHLFCNNVYTKVSVCIEFNYRRPIKGTAKKIFAPAKLASNALDFYRMGELEFVKKSEIKPTPIGID